jgi:hypothetical protein
VSGAAHWSLLEHGELLLRADPALAPRIEGWLPLSAAPVDGVGGGASLLDLRAGAAPDARPNAEPTFRFGSAAGWLRPDGGVQMFADGGSVAGFVEPGRRHARLHATGGGEAELHDQATIASALLVDGMGRALLHAAAAVGPDGAWLLVGDSRAGKSTTCVTLVDAGWGYLSDDQVVLSGGPGAVSVEGWPRRFNLDAPPPAGRSHWRVPVDPRERWPGRELRNAPLAGLLFPRVEAGSPTTLTPLRPADALGRLIRAAPWLLLGAAGASRLLALLGAAAAGPSFSLRLGTDTYRNPEALLRCLEPAGR